MGIKPILFLTDVIQNRQYMNLVSFFSLFSWGFVDYNILPLFLAKCLLSSMGSYMSSIGLGFSQKSDFNTRCSKIVSFSLISAIFPVLWSKPSTLVQNELFEYLHALLGAINGISVAFLLSYNGALTKVGLTSVKDVMFLLISSKELTSVNVASVCLQALVSTWVSFNPSITVDTSLEKLSKSTSEEKVSKSTSEEKLSKSTSEEKVSKSTSEEKVSKSTSEEKVEFQV